ncbi:putative LPS assembly protein LptD [Mucilaginibacter sp. KACC 22063]|uniref:putative LPS assembly protein LptD n=1 Tax=Mucilaginibacter sp. KACC 22063 TaxID=3025666 RepID=UPI002365AD3C|nr:putative LPS assembly protein LptD [Mucilaginibacter sp. KACC 22063]WDF53557.1 putative LPS assembly protein LptD [Mucilaginibacter sp. KACC 22063]
MADVVFAASDNAFLKHLLAFDTTIRRDTVPKVKTPTGKKPNGKGKAGNAAARDTTKSKGGLQSVVKAVAEDSTYTDNTRKIIYLYGKGRVTYEDIELDADYIRVDQKKHLIFASGRKDPKTGRYTGRPIYTQKGQKPAYADSMYLDYTTKKGKIYNPASEQQGNFLSGGLAKKLNENEVAYKNVIYSTCDLPYPDTHFGIVITKGIAEKKQIISGPAYLEIANVPIPIGLPFAFFPKPDSRTSGIMLPTFGEDARLGFFLRDFGYYLALNDNIDLTNTATLYSKGSFEVGTVARYLKRYAYTGTLTLRYGNHNYGNPGDPRTQDFNILWSHSQDPAAHPGSVFSASVNAGTHSYYTNTPAQQNFSIQQITQNTLHSSITYAKTWAGTPFNMNVGLEHSQDLQQKTVSLTLPTVSFNMASITPFDSKDRVGEQKWYQKITISYTSTAKNSVVSVPENQLFTSKTLTERFQSGFQQNIPINLSLNFLKYFQFNPSFNYNEYWNFQTINQYYDRNNLINPTSPVIDTVGGFKRAGTYTISAGLSTKVYGTMQFKKGRLRAIRHVLTPNLSFSYNPNFADPSYGYNKTIVSSATVPYPYTATTYNIFQNSAFPVSLPGRQAGIGLSIDNTLEAKVRPKATDTSQVDKKIQLLQSLSFSTFYNFVADSFKLTPISFSAHTAVFNQKVNISFSGTLNPYVVRVVDSISNNTLVRTPVLVNRYTWQDGHLPRLTAFQVSADMSLNSNAKRSMGNTQTNINALGNTPGLTPQQAERLAMVNQDQSAFVDFNVPWNVNLSYSFVYTNNGLIPTITHTIQARGDVNIAPKWKVTYYSDFDIRHQKVSTCQLGIYRDLHCWDLSVQWVPFGYLKMYSVMLRVKASILQDLKLSKRSDYTSSQYYNPYY